MTQAQSILRYLRSGKSLTPLEAWKKFSCYRLGARIYDLRQRGHPIKRRLVEDGEHRFAQYWMGR